MALYYLPKSFIPASNSASQLSRTVLTAVAPSPAVDAEAEAEAVSTGVRLGGAWMLTERGSMRRAAAMVHSSSSNEGSGHAAMAVEGLARKF